MNYTELWKIFDKLIKEDEKIHIDTIYTNGCTPKDTTKMTNEKECCIQCGLVINKQQMTKAYNHFVNKKFKKELCNENRKKKELKYRKIKIYNKKYNELIEFLGKTKL